MVLISGPSCGTVYLPPEGINRPWLFCSRQGEAVAEVLAGLEPAQARPLRQRLDLRNRERLSNGLRAVELDVPVGPEREQLDPEQGATCPQQIVYEDPPLRHPAELPQHADDLLVGQMMEEVRRHDVVQAAVAEREAPHVAADPRKAGGERQHPIRQIEGDEGEVGEAPREVAAHVRRPRGHVEHDRRSLDPTQVLRRRCGPAQPAIDEGQVPDDPPPLLHRRDFEIQQLRLQRARLHQTTMRATSTRLRSPSRLSPPEISRSLVKSSGCWTSDETTRSAIFG